MGGFYMTWGIRFAERPCQLAWHRVACSQFSLLPEALFGTQIKFLASPRSQAGIDEVRTVKMVLTFCMPIVSLKLTKQ